MVAETSILAQDGFEAQVLPNLIRGSVPDSHTQTQQLVSTSC
jgi:hypothetical protein